MNTQTITDAPLVNIFLVKQEMGHSSVTTTEIYAEFSLRRLEMGFPSSTESNNNTGNGTRINWT